MGEMRPIANLVQPMPLAAFAGAGIVSRQVTIEGDTFTFEPVMARLLAVLAVIDSPFLKFINVLNENMAEMKAVRSKDDFLGLLRKIDDAFLKDGKPAREVVIESVYAFLTPGQKCLSMLYSNRARYTEEANKVLGGLAPGTLAQLEQIAMQQFLLAIISGSLTTQPGTSFN